MHARLFLFCLLLVGVSAAGVRVQEAVEAAPEGVSPLYLTFRETVLGLDAESMGGPAEAAIWAVLIEMGFEEGSASLVSGADGTVSLYYSHGGGMIGLGGFDDVRLAAVLLDQAARRALATMDKVDAHPLPAAGEVCFYLVTPDGVFGANAPAEALLRGDAPFSDLFQHGQAVIHAMRAVDARSESPVE